MRRNDRVVNDINDIYGILKRCTTINLGMNAGDYPYVIPMTFGCSLEDGKITVYFHCASEGRKIDLLKEDSRVCVEGHIYDRIVNKDNNDITALYESVIGFGKAEYIDDPKEKVEAIKIMLAQYDSSGFPAESCVGLTRVEAYKIVLDEVAGKRNK